MRMRIGLAIAAALLVAVALAPGADAREGRWSWHMSAGAISQEGVGITGAIWAGSPTFEELFLRGGLTVSGAGSTAVDAGVVYLLTPVAPRLVARFPNLDPYVAAALTLDTRDARTGIYVGGGATYRLTDRAWGWGELRLGSGPGLVVGLGFSF